MNNLNRAATGRSTLSDREMLYDLFVSGKYLSLLYDQALMSSTNDRVRATIEALQQSEHQMAETLSTMLQQHGWHPNQASRQPFGQRQETSENLSVNRSRETSGNRCSASSRDKIISENIPNRRPSQARRTQAKSELSNLSLD